MSNSTILPSVHASGLWELTTPFNNHLTRNVQYTCIAVRRLEELALQGIDTFKVYYEPFGLTINKHQEDYAKNIAIVTIKNTAGDVKSFPSSYIVRFPSSEGVSYVNLGLGINLGSLPVSKSIDDLILKITELVKDTLGTTPTIKTIQLSEITMVSRDTHTNLENTRKANIKASDTQAAQLTTLKKQLQAKDTLIRELETHLQSSQPRS